MGLLFLSNYSSQFPLLNKARPVSWIRISDGL